LVVLDDVDTGGALVRLLNTATMVMVVVVSSAGCWLLGRRRKTRERECVGGVLLTKLNAGWREVGKPPWLPKLTQGN
jgi:hypothetical protein